MAAILFSASNMLQRVLPRLFSSTASQGSNAGSRMANVRQAGLAAPGRPYPPASPLSYSRARDIMFGLARRESGARREFAIDAVKNANAAFRSGDQVLAGKILATGLATFFPVRITADTASLPEVLHAGWQANFGRGVTALIDRVHDQLYRLHRDVSTDVVHGDPSRDALLEAIREDGSMTVAYRHAITKAAGLNNEGRHEEALATLRTVPMHQSMMAYFAVPVATPGSEVADRILTAAHKELDKLGTLVNGDHEVAIGSLGQQVSYARENPDVLRTRGLIQSVGAELFRRGAYDDAMNTVRPPVPPRVT